MNPLSRFQWHQTSVLFHRGTLLQFTYTSAIPCVSVARRPPHRTAIALTVYTTKPNQQPLTETLAVHSVRSLAGGGTYLVAFIVFLCFEHTQNHMDDDRAVLFPLASSLFFGFK